MVRWWSLLPSGARAAGTALLLAAFGAGVFGALFSSGLGAAIGAVATILVGGTGAVWAEVKRRRLVQVFGWDGDYGALVRVMADADAGVAPADPRLRRLAVSYVRHRLGNTESETIPWLALAVPLFFFGAAAFFPDVGRRGAYVLMAVLYVGIAVALYRNRRILPPRWRQALEAASVTGSTHPR